MGSIDRLSSHIEEAMDIAGIARERDPDHGRFGRCYAKGH
jgi:hypothetical protein